MTPKFLSRESLFPYRETALFTPRDSALFASPFRSRPALQTAASEANLAGTGSGSVGLTGGRMRRSVTTMHAARQSVMPDIEPPRLRREGTETSLDWSTPPTNSQLSAGGLHAAGDLSPSKGPLSRGLSMGARMDTLARNVKEPFALRTASEIEPSVGDTLAGVLDEKAANDGHTRFVSAGGYPPTSEKSTGISSKKGPLRLPFVLSLAQAQSKTERNVPYLRQSWGRIDLIAIVGFWVSFSLSVLGLERGDNHHIGLFRAMSVLRLGRLLGITSGTTVSLWSVLLFLMLKDCLRRSCTLSRLLGRFWPVLLILFYLQ